DRQVSWIAEWQRAIEAEGFALRFSTTGPADELSGSVAAKLGNDDAGFECNQESSADIMARDPDVDFGHAWQFAKGLPQRSHLEVEYCSWIGAAIFAKVTGGKVFDPGADKLSTTKELLSSLREVEHDILQVEVELKKLEERPQEAHAPSPAVISVRLWR